MTSTPAAPFRPRNAATNPAVNHGAKQARRVAEGRNAGFNPLHGMLDTGRLGLAGNSLGASAVSEVASQGPARGRGGGPGSQLAAGTRAAARARASACRATTASARPTAPWA